MIKLQHIEKLIQLNENINIFRFFEFSFNNKIQDRLQNLTKSEEISIGKSIEHKIENNLPFWESYFTVAIESKIIESRIFKNALWHNVNNSYKHIYPANVISFIKANHDQDIALNSKVILKNGNSMHIPLLDFKLKADIKHLAIVKATILELGLNGYILNSGKSYHFIGKKLVSKEKLIEILAKFTLFHPISDKAWAAHQIIEQSASLRVSSKNGVIPQLICET